MAASTTTTNTPTAEPETITIIGAGTIGLSFAALHLAQSTTSKVIIYDTRPDLESYISSNLPNYLTHLSSAEASQARSRLTLASSLRTAISQATIIQEQGPETLTFKQSIWAEIEHHAPADALLWSSTSGIPASQQASQMRDPSRLCVVHPYNPPHIMPLLEIVPSPQTSQTVIDRTLNFWRERGRTPVLLQKEATGFVANRLAFALFREACSLVAQGVVSVEELDAVVTSSMGPRWSVAGPFKAYHAGGGEEGLKGFMDKIGGTVQNCWDASEKDAKDWEIEVGGAWQDDVCRQAQQAYGKADTAERDRKTAKVLQAVKEG